MAVKGKSKKFSRKSILAWAVAAVGASFSGARAYAGLFTEIDSSNHTGFTVPTTATNLLNAATLIANPTTAPVATGNGTSTDWSVLADGSFGPATPSIGGLAAVTPVAGDTLTYQLNTGAAPNGYTITSLDSFTGWQDTGRVNQNYTVYYSTVANPTTFFAINSVAYGGTDASTKVDLTGTLTNVAAIEFVFSTQQSGYVGFRELSAAGTATASPQVLTPPGVLSSAAFNTFQNASSGQVHVAGQMSDINVGLSNNKTYINAVDLNGGALTINNVPFAASSGGNPSGSGTGGTSWFIAGVPNVTTTSGNVGGQLGTLLQSFIFGGTPGGLTLNGLTTGQTYVVTFYDQTFGTGDGRIQTIAGTDGGSGTFNEDPGTAGDGNLVRYTFVANGPSESLSISPSNPANTMHMYGFSTEQVFNNTWQSGTTWSTSVWSNLANGSNLVPNSIGSNGSFGAQGSPTTINLDTNETVGHLQFAGTNAWTISSSNASTLTLQTDVGGVSVLGALAGTHTIAVPIIMQNGILKTGAGSLILSGTVTTGGFNINISNGTLQLNDLGGSDSGAIADNTSLIINNSTNQTLSGVISGAGNLTKIGPGLLALSNTVNTFAGGTTLGAGTLTINADGSLGAVPKTAGTNLTFTGSASLQAGATNVTIGAGRNIAINNGITATFDTQANKMSIAGIISGGNTSTVLSKIGTGTLTLANQNTYLGNTAISAGTVILNGAAAPAGAVAHYTFNSNNANDTAGTNNGTMVGSPTFVSGLSGNAISLNGTSQGVTVPSSTSLNTLTAYTVSFWENLTSNPSGGTFFSTRQGGENTIDIQYTSTGGLHGDIGNGAGGGWLTTAADAGGAGLTNGSWNMVSYTVSGTGYAIYVNGISVATGAFSGTPSFMRTTSVLTLGEQSNGNWMNGLMDEVNIYGSVLTAAQVNALYFSGFNSGVSNNILPTTTNLTIASGAVLDMKGSNQSVASLADFTVGNGGTITNSLTGSASTLTVTPATGNTIFSGIIQDGAGTVALAKTGTGTQTLSGANAYSGGTTISAGKLQIGNNGTSGSLGSGPVTDNATLQFNRTDTLTVANVISGTGNLVQATTTVGQNSILLLGASNSYQGGTTIASGTIRAGNVAAFGTGAVNINAGALALLWFNAGSSTIPNNFFLSSTGGVGSGDTSNKDAIYGDGGAGGGFATYTLGGTITLNSTSTIGGNGANNMLISGKITGSGGLTKGLGRVDENDVLTLTNTANDYAGDTTVTSGTLRLGASNVIPDGAGKGNVIVNTGTTFDLAGNTETIDGLNGAGTVDNSTGTGFLTVGNNNATSLFTGIIKNTAGTLTLIKIGTGTQTLTGANTYIGGTTISAGTLQVGNGGATGTLGTSTVLNNANLIFNNTSGLNITATNAITGTGSITVAAGVLGLFINSSGTISSGTVTVDGTGSANNASFMIWAPSGGSVNNNFVLNSMGPAQNRGAINQDGGAGLVTLNGTITLAGTSRIGVGGASWNSMIINGQITGIGGLYVYEGNNNGNGSTTLVLTNSSNNYSGGTTIENGRLSITNATALGTSPVTITGVGSQLLIDEVTGTIPNNFTLGGGGNPTSNTPYAYGNATMVFHNDGQTATLSGTVTLAGDAKLRAYSSGGTTIFNNPIGGAGNLTFEAGGGAVNHNQYWQLAGSTASTYGNTTIRSDGAGNSIVQLNGGNLPATGTLTLSDAANRDVAFDLNGNNQTIGGLSGAVSGLGDFVMNSSNTFSTLTVSATGATAFGGVIGLDTASTTGQAAGSGNITLIKIGTGTLTFSNANTYTGGTTIGAGKLLITNNTGSATGTGAVEVGGTGTFGGTGISTGITTVDSGGTIQVGSGGAGSLTLGGLTFNGTGTINFGPLANYTSAPGVVVSGTNTFTDSGTPNSVTINVSSIPNIGVYKLIGYAGSTLTSGQFGAFTLQSVLPNRALGTLQNNTNEIDLNITAIDFLKWTGNNTTAWDTTTPNNWKLNSTNAPTTYLDNPGDTVVFDDSAPGTTTVDISAANVNPQSVTFNNGTLNYIVQGSQSIAGSTGLTKNLGATVTINNSNTYTGGTTITGGTLVLGNANALSTGAVTLAGGKLSVGNFTFANNLVGTPATTSSVVDNNPNGASLTGTLTGSGTVNFSFTSNGTLTIPVLPTVSTFTGTVGVDTSSTFMFPQMLTTGAPNATLNVSGGSNGTTTGSFLYVNGSGFVNIGALTGNGFIAAANGGTVWQVGGLNISTNFSGTIEDNPFGGAAALIKVGSATLTLSGTNSSYSGVTDINSGILNVASLSNYGVNGSLGNRSAGAETGAGDGIGIHIGVGNAGATLQYTGSTPTSTNRQIRISAATNTIDASGTGAGTMSFTFNGTNTNLFDTAGARTLILAGSNTGNNTFSISLGDAGGATSLQKSGAGKWVFNATASTYTGNTAVNAGTLDVGNVHALGATGSTVFLQTSSSVLELSTDTGFGGANPVYNITLGNNVGAYSPTITLDRATAGASNSITHNFGLLTMSENGGQPLTLNVNKGPNGTSGFDTIAFTGLSAGNNNAVTETLNPTGGNISIGTVTPVSTNGSPLTLDLDGTTSGNAITGTINGSTPSIAIVKSNSSTWALGGSNTYTGSTTVIGGTLLLKNTNALQNSTLNANIGSVAFDSSVASHAFTFGGLSGPVNIALADNASNSVALTVGGNNASTIYSGVLANAPGGTGSLTKVGTGTLLLANAATYGGSTTVTGGKLALNSAVSRYSFNSGNGTDSVGINNGTLSNTPGFVAGIAGNAVNFANTTNTNSPQYMAVPYNSSLALNNYTVSFWENLNATYATQAAAGQGNPTFVSSRNGGGETTLDIQLSANGLHADIGNGAGWITTSADATTTLNVGTWNMVTYSVNSAANSYTIYVNGASVASGGLGGFTALLMKSGEILTFGSQSASAGGTGSIVGNNNLNAAMDEINIFGSAMSATQINNLYTAKLSTLSAYSNGSLPSTTQLSIAGSSTLDLGGNSQTVASLSDFAPGSGGSIINSNTGTPLTFTLNPASGATTFSGVIGGDSASNAIALNLVGSGTQTLAGANTYTGGTTVGGGKLIVTNTTGSATGTGTVTVINGGTLEGSQATIQGFIAGPVTQKGGAILNAFQGAAQSTGSPLTLTINNTLTLNDTVGSILNFNLTNTPNGTNDPMIATTNLTLNGTGLTSVHITGNPISGTYDLISYTGTLTNFNGFNLATGITGPSPYFYTLFNNTSQDQIDLVVSGTLTWTGKTGGLNANPSDSNWNTSSTNWAAANTPAQYIDGGLLDVQFNDANAADSPNNVVNSNVIVQSAGVSPKSVTFNNSAVNYTVSNQSGSVGITGSTGLLKTGSGTVTLTSVNTYTGITTISGGVLAISVDHALGSNASATVTTGGELKLNNVAYTSQNLTLAGPGTDAALYGTGTSSFAGAITLSDNSTIGASAGSTLTITGGIETSGQGLTLSGGGTINLKAINNTVNPSTGSTVDINGATVNFNANNGYEGTTTIENNGLLRLNSSGALPSGSPTPALVVKTGGILDLNGNTSNVAGATLSGGTINDTLSTATLVAQSVTVNGLGNVINAAVNTGNVNLNANASLVINSAVTGDLNFSDGASLSGTGNITAAANGAFLANNNTLSSTSTLTFDGVTVGGTGNHITSGNLAVTFSMTINPGASLAVNNGATLGGAAPVIVSGTMGGAGTVHSLVDVQSGGHIAPGDSAVGTITTDSLTLESGSILDFEFNATPAHDFINVTSSNGLTLSGGGFNLYQEGTTNAFEANGTYHLIAYNGSFTGSISNLSVLNPQNGAAYLFSNNTSLDEIDLTITAPPHFSVPNPTNVNVLLNGNAAAVVTNDGGATGNYNTSNAAGLSIVRNGSGSLAAGAMARIVLALPGNNVFGGTSSGSFTITNSDPSLSDNTENVTVNVVYGKALANNTDYDYTHSVAAIPTPSQLSHNLNANGDPLFLAANALTADVSSGAPYDGLSSTVVGTTNGGSYVGTTATILKGNADVDKTVTMNWRNRSASETHPTQTVGPMAHPNEFLISDVVLVTGMGLNNVNNSLHVQTDIFALSMSYLPSDLPANETTVANSGGLYLGWLSPTTNTWLNAVAGDFGGMSVSEGFQGAESFSTYFTSNGVLANDLGAWGVDTTNHTVWAVLDHNSEFGVVVPEPTSLGMLGLGALGLLGRKRRKNHA